MEEEVLQKWDDPGELDDGGESWSEMLDELLQGAGQEEKCLGVDVSFLDDFLFGESENCVIAGDVVCDESCVVGVWWNGPICGGEVDVGVDVVGCITVEPAPVEVGDGSLGDLCSVGELPPIGLQNSFEFTSGDVDCNLSQSSDEEWTVSLASSNAVLSRTGSGSDLKEVDLGSPSDSSGVDAPVQSQEFCCTSLTSAEKSQIFSSAEESEEQKKRMRLIRNRESASQSRQRKKSYMKELEMKCRGLEGQVHILQQTLTYTSAENKALKEQLAHLRSASGVVCKSGMVEPAVLPSDSLPSESPSHPTLQCLMVKLFACLYRVFLLVLFLPHLQELGRGANAQKPTLAKVSSSVSSTLGKERRSPAVFGILLYRKLWPFRWRGRIPRQLVFANCPEQSAHLAGFTKQPHRKIISGRVSSMKEGIRSGILIEDLAVSAKRVVLNLKNSDSCFLVNLLT